VSGPEVGGHADDAVLAVHHEQTAGVLGEKTGLLELLAERRFRQEPVLEILSLARQVVFQVEQCVQIGFADDSQVDGAASDHDGLPPLGPSCRADCRMFRRRREPGE